MCCRKATKRPSDEATKGATRRHALALHRHSFRGWGFRGWGRGFSLVEVMVVIVIIGLLAGAVALSMPDKVDKARRERARSDVATIVQAVEMFYAEHGRLPTNDEGLGILKLQNPNDPWGNPYIYNQPGRQGRFDVICFGADGREGGDPDTADADIANWDLDDAKRELPR